MPGHPRHSPRSGRPGGRGRGLSVGLFPRELQAGAGGPRPLASPPPRPAPHLSIEGHAVLGPDEVPIGQVGPLDHRGNCLLVLGRGGGQQWQGGQGNVVLTAGQTALVVAVGAEAGGKGWVRKDRRLCSVLPRLGSRADSCLPQGLREGDVLRPGTK